MRSNHSGFVRAYDEADTYVAPYDFMHLSVNIPNDDFKEFVGTLLVALKETERGDGEPVAPLRVRLLLLPSNPTPRRAHEGPPPPGALHPSSR